VKCRNDKGGDTCEGVVTNEECIDYTSCEGFFNEQICPSVFEALGSAAGYASVVNGILATLYSIVAKAYAQKQSGKREREVETANAKPKGNAKANQPKKKTGEPAKTEAQSAQINAAV